MDQTIRDVRPLSRWVIRGAWASAFFLVAESIAELCGGASADWENDSVAVHLASVGLFLSFFGALIIALRWIYLVSKAAYILTDGETTKPGWAVGWYFVPFANLWKPYEAMREAWQVSQNVENWPQVPTDYLPTWWGLWISFNIVSNLSARLPSEPAMWLGLVAALLSIPLAWMFTRLVRDLSAALSGARVAEVFA